MTLMYSYKSKLTPCVYQFSGELQREVIRLESIEGAPIKTESLPIFRCVARRLLNHLSRTWSQYIATAHVDCFRVLKKKKKKKKKKIRNDMFPNFQFSFYPPRFLEWDFLSDCAIS